MASEGATGLQLRSLVKNSCELEISLVEIPTPNPTDDEVVDWFNSHGTPKTSEEIQAWSAGVEGYRPYDDPENIDDIEYACPDCEPPESCPYATGEAYE